MKTSLAPSLLSPRHLPLLSLLLAPLLGACGEPVFEMQGPQGRLEFNDLRTRYDQSSSLLVTCGTRDPLPIAVDDETGLCVHLRLESGQLEALPATLAIEGEATVSPQATGLPAYTRGPGQAPSVGSVWAQASCFAPPPQGPLVQQVRGTLQLRGGWPDRPEGHLSLQVSGQIAGPCGGSQARFNFNFKAEP